ncbi:MAG: hypothetical protein V7K38_24295 [Nostoc sp.]
MRSLYLEINAHELAAQRMEKWFWVMRYPSLTHPTRSGDRTHEFIVEVVENCDVGA